MARRPKRRSPLLMEMEHARSVRLSDRAQLRAELDDALAGLPDDLRMGVTRAATLSAEQAIRQLEMAKESRDDLDADAVERARAIIERFSVVPR